MNNVVKITTKMRLIDLLCPHTCRGCGRLGSILCECCKKYIFERQVPICPLCKQNIRQNSENMLRLCSDCESDFDGLWAVGWREGALDHLIKDYKYHAVRAAGPVLAELLDYALPRDVGHMVIVPLPTIGRHVRERGLDHTLNLAKKLAVRRDWRVERLLGRATDTVQVGASVAKRQEQAKNTYVLEGELDATKSYLLLDDIWTTGASMKAAARVLREAGAKNVFGAVIAISKEDGS